MTMADNAVRKKISGGKKLKEYIMKHVILAAALTMGLASPAFASNCTKSMAEIDAALATNPQLSAEQLAEVTARRAEGAALHDSGKHQEAVDTLAKATEILGVE